MVCCSEKSVTSAGKTYYISRGLMRERAVNALKDGKVDGLIVAEVLLEWDIDSSSAARTVLEIGNEAEVNTGYVWVTADNMNDDTITPFLYE